MINELNNLGLEEPEEVFVTTSRPFYTPNQEMMNGSQIKIEENKQEDTKIIPLKDKYKKQEEHENESIILKEEDIKKMFQISSRKLTLNPNNYNITNEEQQQNTDLMELTSSFKKFLRKLLFYFMGIILSTSLVIITILCYLEYHFSDICIYTAFFGWCLLNLIFFLLLNNQSLSRERKIYEFSELLIISFIIVFIKAKDYIQDFYKIYCLIPHALGLLLAWHYLVKKHSPSSFIWHMGFRIFSFIQAFHIYLRLDGFVQWPIITIFWPTWIILTVVFFYLMGIALMIMLAFYYKCLGQDENLHTKGLIWTFLCLSCLDGGGFLIIKGFVNKFESEAHSDLIFGLVFTLTYLISIMIFSKLSFEEIINFFIVLLEKSHEEDGILDTLQIQPAEPEKPFEEKKEIYKIKLKKDIPLDMPILMQKLSSTYYQRVMDIPNQIILTLHKKNKNDSKDSRELRDSNDAKIDAKSLSKRSKTKTSQPEYICLICFDNLADAVFLECGHGGICYKCAIDVWKSNGECFLCRKSISKTLKIDVFGSNGEYKKIIGIAELQKQCINDEKNITIYDIN